MVREMTASTDVELKLRKSFMRVGDWNEIILVDAL